MKKLIFPLIILGFLIFILFREIERNQIGSIRKENSIVTSVRQKIDSLKTPSRVEVRNYIKDKNHRYQKDVLEIKKMKTKLDSKSDVYLELNLFVNESDEDAPLVAQFMLFDSKTQNLLQEENLNLTSH